MKYFNVKIDRNADGTHSVEVRGVSRAYWQTPCYENENEDYKALLNAMAGQGTSRLGPYIDTEQSASFSIPDAATVGSIRDLLDAEIKWTRALCVLNNSIPHEGSLTKMLPSRYGRIPSGDMIFVYGGDVYVKSREEVIKANIRRFKHPIPEATRRLASWVIENEDGLAAAEWTELINNPLTTRQFESQSYNPFITKAEFAEQFFFAEDAFGAERAPKIRVPVKGGYIVAGRNSDPDYDGVYVVFETNDGNIIDLALVECKKENDYSTTDVYCYEDVTKEEWTRKYSIQHEDIGKETAPASMVVPGAVPESELRKTAGLSTTGPLANYECEGQMSFEDIGWTVPGGDGTLPEPQSAAEAELEEAEEEEIPLD